MKISPLKRFILAGMSFLLLVLPASATWSIVVINQRTGEVGIACATCIPNYNLELGVPVIVVGKGAAAAQSFVDMTGANRKLIFSALKNSGADPQAILDALDLSDMQHQTRQYGILSLAGGGPVTFTGSRAGSAAAGVVGQVGDYVYAIQGNVLTADEVVFSAESAFVATNGDMGQRLMAAMQAARALGGDGRCSCSNNAPTSCGAPPPGFTKSAHCGFLIVARMGNTNGNCSALRGCANGTYHLNLNIRNNQASAGSPDPVLELQRFYNGWRQNRIGRPDGVNFGLQAVDSLPADGLTQHTVTVQLRDIDDNPLTSGGAQVTVRHSASSAGLISFGPVTDNGDGSYSFDVTAGTGVGMDTLIIKASDGVVAPDLFPHLKIRSDAVSALHLGYDSISAGDGSAQLPFQLNLPGLRTGAQGGRYVLLGSMAGSSPGIHVGLGMLPLNLPILFMEAGHPVRKLRDAGIRSLDAQGRASDLVNLDGAMLLQLMGRRLDFAALYMDDAVLRSSNATGVQIVP